MGWRALPVTTTVPGRPSPDRSASRTVQATLTVTWPPGVTAAASTVTVRGWQVRARPARIAPVASWAPAIAAAGVGASEKVGPESLGRSADRGRYMQVQQRHHRADRGGDGDAGGVRGADGRDPRMVDHTAGDLGEHGGGVGPAGGRGAAVHPGGL